MNSNELVLQKLEEMEARQQERYAATEARLAEMEARQQERDAARDAATEARLAEMEVRQQERDAARDAATEARLVEMEVRQQERDAAVEIRLTNLEDAVKEILKDGADQRLNQVKLEGAIQTLDTKVGGKDDITDMMSNAVRDQLDKLKQKLEEIVEERWWAPRVTKLETFAEKLDVTPDLLREFTQTIEYREEAEKIIRVQEQYPEEFQAWVSSVKSPVDQIERRLFLSRDKVCEILTDMKVEYQNS